MPNQSRGWYCEVAKETSWAAETILFVEDEKFVREVTSEVLGSAGYWVLVAKNAAELWMSTKSVAVK
jgi:DNA-binding NtrC family response regulator